MERLEIAPIHHVPFRRISACMSLNLQAHRDQRAQVPCACICYVVIFSGSQIFPSDPLAYRSPRIVEQDCPGEINRDKKGPERKDIEQVANGTLDI